MKPLIVPWRFKVTISYKLQRIFFNAYIETCPNIDLITKLKCVGSCIGSYWLHQASAFCGEKE